MAHWIETEILKTKVGYSLTKTSRGSVSSFELQDGARKATNRSRSTSEDEALYNMRRSIIGPDHLVPMFTTAERDASTGFKKGQTICNITLRKTEVFDGSVFI